MRVSLCQGGQQRARVLATSTNFERTWGPALVLIPPPKLAPPERCIPLAIGAHLPGASTAGNMEYRYGGCAVARLGEWLPRRIRQRRVLDAIRG
jgi:hypothetical protein